MSNPVKSHIAHWFRKGAVIKFIIIVAIAVTVTLLPLEGLNLAQRLMLGIFAGAAGLWVTEAIPPFATAILVIVLQVYLLGMPEGPFAFADQSLAISYQVFLNPIASPILVLFFGGFILALAASKHGLDRRMAQGFLTPFGRRPAMILLGVILITAVFSMFMSNTATTAMMIAIMAPFYRSAPPGSVFPKMLILAVPFAANVGGIGTVIGTPPNAVAASILGGMGKPISFIEWMSVGVPVAVVLLFALWVLLLLIFRPGREPLEVSFGEPLRIGPRLILVSGTFGLTVLLWMTEPLHALPAALAAMIPIVVFTTTGIINNQDLKKIDWDVLILVAGGLSLGVGMERTGLSTYIVNLIPFEAFPLLLLALAFGVLTVVISNFMSNTSAANLLIPIAVAIAVWSPMVGAFVVAMTASMAMSLPVSTPPNAIAYATGRIQTKDMALIGSLVSLIGVTVVMIGLMLLMKFTNLIAV